MALGIQKLLGSTRPGSFQQTFEDPSKLVSWTHRSADFQDVEGNGLERQGSLSLKH